MTFDRLINTPIKFIRGNWYVNERIVEIPFVFSHLPDKPCKILELGCTRSVLSIQLASMGHEVTGIDIRDYHFRHPNFEFQQGNFLDININKKYDYIISVSTLEHVGIEYKSNLKDIINKMYDLCDKMIHTFPVCLPYKDKKLQSFTREEVGQMFSSFNITDEQYYKSIEGKYWKPVEETMNIRLRRNPTGINVVGCFTFEV